MSDQADELLVFLDGEDADRSNADLRVVRAEVALALEQLSFVIPLLKGLAEALEARGADATDRPWRSIEGECYAAGYRNAMAQAASALAHAYNLMIIRGSGATID